MTDTSVNTSVDTLRKVVGAGSVGFGLLALAAPSALRAAYGDSVSSGAALDYFGRAWGSRTTALGVLTLTATSKAEVKRLGAAAAAMDAIDSIAALRADGLPSTTRRMAALTSAAFAVASGYVAMNA